MIADQKYWNPVLETFPRDRLRDLQLKKFKRIFQWAYDHSKFHRNLYQRAGLGPRDIRSFEDIRRVPKVEKAMMREIQCKDQLRLKTNLAYRIEFYDYGRLPRYEVKARRFKDLRKKNTNNK